MSNPVALDITGMHCAGCARKVERTLNELSSLETAEVNIALNRATIRPANAKGIQDAINAIDGLGYKVQPQSYEFVVEGMHCASCVSKVEHAAADLSGVLKVSVNLATGKVYIEALESLFDQTELRNSIKALGYSLASTSAPSPENDIKEHKKPWLQSGYLLLAAIVLCIPLVSPMLGLVHPFPALEQFLLALPIQAVLGYRFYRGSYHALKSGYANMDVLVALGTSAAFFYSLYHWLAGSGGGLYFESSALVMTLISLGKWFEERAKRKTASALDALLSLKPQKARVWKEDSWSELAIAEVQQGDRIQVRPGETIPVDGKVIKGESELDEALITGESEPQLRSSGDKVITGSMNGSGTLEIEAIALGKDTALSKIIHLVEQAQAGKAPVQQLVDRVSAIFVPAVLAIAFITLITWLTLGYDFEPALLAAVSVLVIACPCALGLATPAALLAGTGVAARQGILIRDLNVLEAAQKIDWVFFDKTGTLTRGQPTVTETYFKDEHALAATAALQSSSEHPLAKAFVTYAADQQIKATGIESFKARAGKGVEGIYQGQTIMAGSQSWFKELSIRIPEDARLQALTQRPGSLVHVAMNQQWVGSYVLEDQARDDSAGAIKALHERQLKTGLLSGDRNPVVESLAFELSIDNAKGELLPADKVSVIKEAQSQGLHIAMVGDGINDAPALAQADIGIAMGSGTDVARESAAITLIRPQPALVAAALEICRLTRNKIKQNLFWAFIFNIIGIPLAAFGLLSPAIAGAAMACSSVIVLTNALLLQRWKARN
ncbi:heavy metal translocating P-type ATPase [Pokkaliibacter sp. CJK22405]|uniref:heavy metal translocating P-type ATPase n=1 Tax=Pokkaliibacter sp. CJK22405 TaxID=3384615 RepID=UPI0039850871